jgi:hypothetical protein
MEMTFPHFAPRQDSDSWIDHKAMLATAIARQANSRTVHAVRRAEAAAQIVGDNAEQRMHYFAHADLRKVSVRGAFWRNVDVKPKSEADVYHAGSTNIKVRDLEDVGTGEQLNHAGHGAVRKL